MTVPASILVVDDDEMNREIMQAFLELDRYTVRMANSGQAALAACRAAVPGLLLLDVNLPDMTGYEVCRALRAEPATQTLPIVILTGYSSKEDQDAARAAGATAFVSRPFQGDALLQLIRDLLAPV
ncbi:MAG: response regulator [Anaerolineae bacterium]|jgi:CheY-like chemotaxis protein|nr:response regulator [Anaerolineae bacterium]